MAGARFKTLDLRRAARRSFLVRGAAAFSPAHAAPVGQMCMSAGGRRIRGYQKDFKRGSRSMVEMSRENQKSTQHEHDGRNGAFVANHRMPPPTIAMVPKDCGRSGHVLGPRKGAAP